MDAGPHICIENPETLESCVLNAQQLGAFDVLLHVDEGRDAVPVKLPGVASLGRFLSERGFPVAGRFASPSEDDGVCNDVATLMFFLGYDAARMAVVAMALSLRPGPQRFVEFVKTLPEVEKTMYHSWTDYFASRTYYMWDPLLASVNRRADETDRPVRKALTKWFDRRISDIELDDQTIHLDEIGRALSQKPDSLTPVDGWSEMVDGIPSTMLSRVFSVQDLVLLYQCTDETRRARRERLRVAIDDSMLALRDHLAANPESAVHTVFGWESVGDAPDVVGALAQEMACSREFAEACAHSDCVIGVDGDGRPSLRLYRFAAPFRLAEAAR